jgi:hypothetical protein
MEKAEHCELLGCADRLCSILPNLDLNELANLSQAQLRYIYSRATPYTLPAECMLRSANRICTYVLCRMQSNMVVIYLLLRRKNCPIVDVEHDIPSRS